MRLFGKATGTIDRHARASWLTPPFDGAYATVPAPAPTRARGRFYQYPASTGVDMPLSTFAASSFRSRTFASGSWAGTGVTPPTTPAPSRAGRQFYPYPAPPRRQQRRELIELTLRPVFGQVLDCPWILTITPHPVQPLDVPFLPPEIPAARRADWPAVELDIPATLPAATLPSVELSAQFARFIEVLAVFGAIVQVQVEFGLSVSLEAQFGISSMVRMEFDLQESHKHGRETDRRR